MLIAAFATVFTVVPSVPAVAPVVANAETCATLWFAKGGRAPKSPPVPPKDAPPTQLASYLAAMKVYRTVAARYATAAKAFGQECILGTGPRRRPETRADAEGLVTKYVTVETSFVMVPPTDIADFCPGYLRAATDAKVHFWRTLFLAIIPPESGFDNASIMLDGDQYSIGLFQMSLKNGCGVSSERELVDPERNTTCAVHKMEQLERPRRNAKAQPLNVIGGDGAAFDVGAASYWGTLRARREKSTGRMIGPRGDILDKVSRLDGCRLQSASDADIRP